MNFNPNQLKALEIGKNIAVSAGAGSGKTRVLTARYIKLLEEGNVNVSEIVAITFTNKAALEMKERIRTEIDNKIMKDKYPEKWIKIKEDFQMANISTIHSFCMNIVRENASLIGIDPEFSIIDEYQGKLMFDKILNEETKKGIFDNQELAIDLINSLDGELKAKKLLESLISEVKNIYYSIRNDGKDPVEVGYDEIKSSFILNVVRKVHERFTRIKYENGVVDFNDLEFMTLEILKNKDIKKRYRNIYKKFLIDEFQDTNELQKKIIYSFVWENGTIPASLFVVGDHKQAIYGFRGTDFRVFREVMEDIGNTVELDICYRSKPSIISGINDSFKGIISNYEELRYPEEKELGDEKDINIVTIDCKKEKASEGNVKFDKEDSNIEEKLARIREDKFLFSHNREIDEEGKLIADSVVKLVQEGYKLRDIAILLRSRNVLSGVTDDLREANINYVVLGGLGFFEKQEVIDLLFLYNAVARPGDRKSLFGALRSPAFSINDIVLYNLNKYLQENNDFEYCLNKMKDSITAEEYHEISQALQTLLSVRKGIPGKRVYDILRDILNFTDFHNKMLSFEEGEKAFRNIEKLLNLANQFDKKPLLSPVEFYDYLKEYSEATNEEDAPLDTENSDAVKIMTIHASKGLEFGCVILPYLNKTMSDRTEKDYRKRLFLYDGNNIISKAQEEGLVEEIIQKEIKKSLEEEQRILYVAATRAKEKLILIGKEKKKKTAKGESATIKNYLDIFRNDSKYISENILNDIPDGKLVLTDLKDFGTDENAENILMDYKIKGTGKFSFSISRYFEYKSCGRKYYYKYVENIPERYYGIGNEKRAGYGAILGTAVHEILELKPNDETIQKISDKYSINNDFLKKFVNSYLNIENKYSELYNSYNLVWSKSEYEIKYRYKNITFTGFIDRFDVYENKGIYYAAVIDYKTNYISGNLERVVEKYTPQLTLYSLAVRDFVTVNGSRLDNVKSYLYLLDKDILMELNYENNLEDFNNIYNEMVKIELQENIEEFQKDLSMCSFCGYNKICEVK